MYGFTIYSRDGDEVYTSEPEYDTSYEAYADGEMVLMDMNQGSVEVWDEDC